MYLKLNSKRTSKMEFFFNFAKNHDTLEKKLQPDSKLTIKIIFRCNIFIHPHHYRVPVLKILTKYETILPTLQFSITFYYFLFTAGR